MYNNILNMAFCDRRKLIWIRASVSGLWVRESVFRLSYMNFKILKLA